MTPSMVSQILERSQTFLPRKIETDDGRQQAAELVSHRTVACGLWGHGGLRLMIYPPLELEVVFTIHQLTPRQRDMKGEMGLPRFGPVVIEQCRPSAVLWG